MVQWRRTVIQSLLATCHLLAWSRLQDSSNGKTKKVDMNENAWGLRREILILRGFVSFSLSTFNLPFLLSERLENLRVSFFISFVILFD